MNFWRYVAILEQPLSPQEIGSTLYRCHAALRSFSQPLPVLAILTESLSMLQEHLSFSASTQSLLRTSISSALEALASLPYQPLHGDAHLGNAVQTASGLLWTDWEDAFSGPVEWDIASAIWNAKILDEDHHHVSAILAGYSGAGGCVNQCALHHCLVARAAVMSVWYPVLYPNPSAERRAKLAARLQWLQSQNANLSPLAHPCHSSCSVH
jgi:thiamine kinase-like enzyme